MKNTYYKNYVYLLVLLFIASNCKKKDDEKVEKKGTIEGFITFFETNDPLVNHEVFLYGRKTSVSSYENVKIASTTSDSNGQYKINFQFTDELDNLNIWVTSKEGNNFSGKDINKYKNTEYDLTGYSGCYLQGVIPNTTDTPIMFNTLNSRDLKLYPYNTISFTVINDSCFNNTDAIEISIKNAISNSFTVSSKFIGNCDTSNTGKQYIIPPTILRWKVTKNNLTTMHYDTLNPVSCEMLNYVIHY